MDRYDTDMSIEVAERGVDIAFQTTAWALTIEFQGGEPTANWDVLRHIVEYARAKSAETKKVLSFALVTNLSLMDDEKLQFLLDLSDRDAAEGGGTPARAGAALHRPVRLRQGGARARPV